MLKIPYGFQNVTLMRKRKDNVTKEERGRPFDL